MKKAAPEKAKNNSPNGHERMIAMLLDPKKPMEQRVGFLVSALQTGEAKAARDLVMSLLKTMELASEVAEYQKLKVEFQQALQEVEQGSVRPATFIEIADADLPGPKPRARVVTPDGQERFPFLHPSLNPTQFSCGQTVLLDAKGTVVLGTSKLRPTAGPHATYHRRTDCATRIEVSVRDEKVTLYASDEVLEAAENGDLKRGDRVLISPQQQFAFAVVPADEDRRHRFVDHSRLPQVLPHRDVGNPHACLGWLVRRTRMLVFRDDICQKYDLRPRATLLMSGPSGTGKTLTIKCFLTLFGQMIRERTGRDDLESRVIRVKMSEELSEWLGRSDKNFERLFDDIVLLASADVQTASGQYIRLPVVVIFEEVEGLARRRSAGNHDGTGGAMDRIMGTLLQRLDDPMDELSQLKLVFISTTNAEAMIDRAMHRRLGAKIARFGRLDRPGFAAVLEKKIKPGYPLASQNGTPSNILRQQLLDEVVANLFDPQNDPIARLELTLGDGTKLEKYPRDFLTGAIVEQAVADAIDELVFHAEESRQDDLGLCSSAVIRSLRRQVDALAENVTAHNAADYVDVPEHTQVANVRRHHHRHGRLGELVVPTEDA